MKPVLPAPLVITVGDPLGIGPEVVCGAYAVRKEAGRPVNGVVVGDVSSVLAAAADIGLPAQEVKEWQTPNDHTLAVLSPPEGEPVEIAAIRYGVKQVLNGCGSALVTGPINKAKLQSVGFAFTGHTDFLGHLCGVENPVMSFVGSPLRVALVTVHIPIAEVPTQLTTSKVLHTIRTAHGAIRENLGFPNPKIWVCGLNPHAGESGRFGTEEERIIAPAVEVARKENIPVIGPVSAETAFSAVQRGEGDCVVAMYHDQGLLPLKVLCPNGAVNWTLGLPIVRTSVDHGTAYDIVGEGKADATSMGEAIRLAEILVGVDP